MIRLSTFAELCRQRHSLGLYCVACDRWSDANLTRLVAMGMGERDIVDARFRCRNCGKLAEKQVRPPVSNVPSAKPYIGG